MSGGESEDGPIADRATVGFFRAVIEHVAHPIFVKNRDYRFILVNDAFCEMLGYPQEHILGKTDFDLVPTEQANFFRRKDAEMFARAATVDIEEEPVTDADGVLHVLSTTKVPFRDASGEVTHLVGIIKDITKLRQAEQLLRDANEQLERRVELRTAQLQVAQEQLLRKERLAVLGELAGGVAHQLRNPLAAIRIASAVVQQSALNPPQQAALVAIKEEVRRADQIIDGLLSYARIRPASRRDVPVGDLVSDTLAHEAIPANVSLSVNVPASLTVHVDPFQAQNALENIIRNAIEAMPDGGDLAVTVEGRDTRVQLVVSDSGPGVHNDIVDSLFAPLVTSKPQGIGLGLSTARRLIDNQGGRLYYEPAASGGASFVVDLPATPAAPRTPNAARQGGASL